MLFIKKMTLHFKNRIKILLKQSGIGKKSKFQKHITTLKYH
jgi:hypothetical protein